MVAQNSPIVSITDAEFEKIVTEQRKMIENIKNQAMER